MGALLTGVMSPGPMKTGASSSGVAIIDDGGPTTWAELDERVDRLVGHLRSIGLPVGAPVLVVSTNRREVVELMLACHEGGWEFVPANWHFTAVQVGQVVADIGMDVVVVDSALIGLVCAALGDDGVATLRQGLVLDDGSGAESWPDGFVSYEAALDAAHQDPVPAASPGGAVFYTSGITGRARGVRLLGPSGGSRVDGVDTPVSHLVARAIGVARIAEVPAGGRTLLVGPHYHWAQWMFGVAPLLLGSTLVIQHRFIPGGALRAIDEHQITNTMLVPTQFVRLLRLDAVTRRSFSGASLRTVVHGAAPCAPETKRAMIDWWGPIIREYSGATEGGVVTMISSEEWLERPGSVGRATPWKDIEIVSDDGRLAQPGRDGVVHVRNRDGIDIEFVGAPAVTTAVHARPGFVTFSDIGRRDADGYLFLSDRSTDMIVSGGTNVSSSEVEAVLGGHPDVDDVAVFGAPDASSGQAIVAALQLTNGRVWGDDVEHELRELCASHLAPHQCPVRYEYVSELPRTVSGKLVKRQLRAEHWGYPID